MYKQGSDMGGSVFKKPPVDSVCYIEAVGRVGAGGATEARRWGEAPGIQGRGLVALSRVGSGEPVAHSQVEPTGFPSGLGVGVGVGGRVQDGS